MSLHVCLYASSYVCLHVSLCVFSCVSLYVSSGSDARGVADNEHLDIVPHLAVLVVGAMYYIL